MVGFAEEAVVLLPCFLILLIICMMLKAEPADMAVVEAATASLMPDISGLACVTGAAKVELVGMSRV